MVMGIYVLFAPFSIILNNSTIFPFTLENNETLLGITSSNLPSPADFLPSFDISSKLINLTSLSNYDIDDNLTVT